jgi:energy-converting hydrogenase A subunit R
VGDSITDVEALKLVRQGGGLTLAFNGNSFAVREAEVAALSENALATAMIADVFNKFGKDEVFSVIREWKRAKVEKLDLHLPLKESLLKSFEMKFPRVELITSENMERLIQESSSFRKSVRGEAVGMLG